MEKTPSQKPKSPLDNVYNDLEKVIFAEKNRGNGPEEKLKKPDLDYYDNRIDQGAEYPGKYSKWNNDEAA